jgi:hypothetical protein
MDVAVPITNLYAIESDGCERIAITCARTGSSFTHRELAADARVLANAFTRLGLERGDTVGYRVADGLGFYALAAACFALHLKLRLLDGHSVPPRSEAPKLIISPAEPSASASEWLSFGELRLFGRDPVNGAVLDQSEISASEAGCLSWAIRPLRNKLTLLRSGDGPQGEAGEIVLRPTQAGSGAASATELRTGDVGELTSSGELVVRGRLSDIAVRGGQAILASDIDCLLLNHPAVGSSISFRERGVAPTEPIVTICETSLCEAELRAWQQSHVDPAWWPSTIVSMPRLPSAPGRDAATRQLRAVIDGSAANAVVEALTARRFRRSGCFKEAELRQLAQSALTGCGPLEFLMFWGCGPRDMAASPDRVALEALGDLLATVEQNGHLQARADIIFTDGHAANNGHPAAHARSYFASVRDAAAGLNVTFHLESEVWKWGALSRDMICALERTAEFATKWSAFPLRERFIQQASRHSRSADPVGAARHYYATCLLERDVLKARFPRAVFLTYNGPEFNECFPDLPTLYIYPGPRGRTDKPWFVGDAGDVAQPSALAVAAE